MEVLANKIQAPARNRGESNGLRLLALYIVVSLSERVYGGVVSSAAHPTAGDDD